MARQLVSRLSATVVVLSFLLSHESMLLGGGHGGCGGAGAGGHGGFAGHGGYGGYGYRGYGGFYGGRGWGYGYGPFWGFGFGVGIYAPYPYYDPIVVPGAYPAVSYASPGVGEPPLAGAPPTNAPSANAPADENAPPKDNAAHLQLMVPENAEVWIAGTKSPQTGKVQEVVTPPLTPGKRYSYKIEVRYTDSNGKPVVDERKIRFRANDWYSVDFTRPVPPPPGKLSAPVPLPFPEENGK